MVHYEAKIHNIKGEKSEHSAMGILRKQWAFTLPLIVITIFMLTGYSPAYSAILGLATCIAVSYKDKDTRIDLTLVWIAASLLIGQLLLPWIITPMMGESGIAFMEKIFSARLLVLYGLVFSVIMLFYRRSRGAGATVGVIGIIIGVLTYSGLVLTFADIVIELAGGSLVLTILFIALASLVLGMGVPVTAAYLITAVVAVPALIHLGVNEIAAHMIVYWLSQPRPICGKRLLPLLNLPSFCIWDRFYSDMSRVSP
jgi:TRAP-type uncharacterized transport system fused permease subunit